MIHEVTPEKTTDEWCELLRNVYIPNTKVNYLNELLEDEHLNAVGLFEEYDHPSEGRMRVVRSPFMMQGVEHKADQPTQLLGQANEKVLAELGIDRQEMEQLKEEGVIEYS